MQKYALILAAAVVAIVNIQANAADTAATPTVRDVFKEGFVGTWTSDDEILPTVYIFTVNGDKLGGVACSPCNDLKTIYQVADGSIVNGSRATFYLIDSGDGSPQWTKRTREEVTAVLLNGVLAVTRGGKTIQLRRPVART